MPTTGLVMVHVIYPACMSPWPWTWVRSVEVSGYVSDSLEGEASFMPEVMSLRGHDFS